MNQAAPAPMPPLSKGMKLFLAALTLLMLGVFALNVKFIINEYQLGKNGIVVEATILDWATYGQATDNENQLDYEVQYEFSVDGEVYTFGDATGRKDLWASIPREDWDISQGTGVIDVVYSAKDPWNNRPKTPDEWPYGGAIAGLVITGLMSALLILVLKTSK